MMICEAPTGGIKVWAVMEKTCWCKVNLVLIQIYGNQSVKRWSEISRQSVKGREKREDVRNFAAQMAARTHEVETGDLSDRTQGGEQIMSN